MTSDATNKPFTRNVNISDTEQTQKTKNLQPKNEKGSTHKAPRAGPHGVMPIRKYVILEKVSATQRTNAHLSVGHPTVILTFDLPRLLCQDGNIVYIRKVQLYTLCKSSRNCTITNISHSIGD